MTYVNLFRDIVEMLKGFRKGKKSHPKAPRAVSFWEDMVKRSVPVLKRIAAVTKHVAYIAFPVSFVLMCVMVYGSAVDAGEQALAVRPSATRRSHWAVAAVTLDSLESYGGQLKDTGPSPVLLRTQ